MYERSSSKNIYLNVAVNTLKKLRSRSNSCPSPVTSTSSCVASHLVISHPTSRRHSVSDRPANITIAHSERVNKVQ